MKSGFNMSQSIFSRFKGTKITEITYMLSQRDHEKLAMC